MEATQNLLFHANSANFNVSVSSNPPISTKVTHRFIFLFIDEIGLLSLLDFTLSRSDLSIVLTPTLPSWPIISLSAPTQPIADLWFSNLSSVTRELFIDCLARIPLPTGESTTGKPVRKVPPDASIRLDGLSSLTMHIGSESIVCGNRDTLAQEYLQSHIPWARAQTPQRLPSEAGDKLRDDLERELVAALSKGRTIPEREEVPELPQPGGANLTESMVQHSSNRLVPPKRKVTEEEIMNEIRKRLK
jgi:hypothetical protein